jgi:Flp pilus assembly protein TadD
MLDSVNEAMTDAEEVNSLGGANPRIRSLLTQVDAFVEAGESDLARKALTSSLNKFGQHAELLVRLAKVERDSGHLEEADACFRKAIAPGTRQSRIHAA